MSGGERKAEAPIVELLEALLAVARGEVPAEAAAPVEPDRVVEVARRAAGAPGVGRVGDRRQKNVDLHVELAEWLRAAAAYYRLPQHELVERGLQAVRIVMAEELGPVPEALLTPPTRK